jgi:gliding motility-associated-like protein
MEGPKVYAGSDKTVCTGDEVSLAAYAAPAAAGYVYSWYAPDGSVTVDSQLVIAAALHADSGVFVAQVLGNTNVCFGRDTVNVVVKPLPDAPGVVSPLELCVNGQVGQLRAEGNFLKWYEDAVGGAAYATAPTPSLDKAGHQFYYVSALVDGCESERAVIDVSVLNCCGSELVVPTAITPNGDGRNDYFSVLRGTEGTGVDVRIFNRWGESVFRGGAKDRWDGTQNGQPVPMGTYYYIISLDCRNGRQMQRKGEVTVLR